jgi:hypothetical protein
MSISLGWEMWVSISHKGLEQVSFNYRSLVWRSPIPFKVNVKAGNYAVPVTMCTMICANLGQLFQSGQFFQTAKACFGLDCGPSVAEIAWCLIDGIHVLCSKLRETHEASNSFVAISIEVFISKAL